VKTLEKADSQILANNNQHESSITKTAVNSLFAKEISGQNTTTERYINGFLAFINYSIFMNIV
jgi:hypothetical protein